MEKKEDGLIGTNYLEIPIKVDDKSIDAKKIVQESAKYLTSQKRDDGYNNYIAHFDTVCNNSAQCPFGINNVLPINNSWSALGFYSASKVLNDKSYLELAKKDLVNLNQYCTSNIEECLWVLAQPSIIQKDEKGTIMTALLNEAGEKLLSKSDANNIMILSIEARELALLYSLTSNSKFIEEAQKRIQLAQIVVSAAYSQNNNSLQQSLNPLQACWYTLGSAEIARATGKPEYLQEALRIEKDLEFKSTVLNSHFSVYIEPCVETYILLSELTADTYYKDQAYIIFKQLIENFWDSSERPLVWGEGGITTVSKKNLSSIQPIELSKQVNVTDTSYFLYLAYLMSK